MVSSLTETNTLTIEPPNPIHVLSIASELAATIITLPASKLLKIRDLLENL